MNLFPQNGNRRGAAMSAALVCCLACALILSALVRQVVIRSRGQARQLQQLQAYWLVQAGLDRARHRLQRDAAYAGEVWRLDQGQLPAVAEVQIRVNRADQQATIDVVAAYPLDDPSPTRSQKTLIRQLPSTMQLPAPSDRPPAPAANSGDP